MVIVTIYRWSSCFLFHDYCSELISVAEAHGKIEMSFRGKAPFGLVSVTCIFSQTRKNEDFEGSTERKRGKAGTLAAAVTTTTCFPWDFLTWWEYYLKASSSIELIRFRISRMDSRVTGAMTSFSSTCRPASTISIVVTPGMGKSRREEKAK